MPAAFAPGVIKTKINPKFLPFIDRVLIAELKLGDAGKHEAISKVLRLVPEWRRGDCWRRIRQLRRLSAWENQTASPQNQPLAFNSRKCHARSVSRPWTAEDDAKLLDWAGYEPVSKIAQRLGRFAQSGSAWEPWA